jgi:hypothetical protein
MIKPAAKHLDVGLVLKGTPHVPRSIVLAHAMHRDGRERRIRQ